MANCKLNHAGMFYAILTVKLHAAGINKIFFFYCQIHILLNTDWPVFSNALHYTALHCNTLESTTQYCTDSRALNEQDFWT